MNSFIVGTSIFILVYVAIISEKYHKSVVALLGASAMLFLHILTQEEAFYAIDLNVIFLLVGMMIIVHIMSKTGVFQWLAIILAQKADGEPLKILLLLSLASAVISAFLDNVTTMLLFAPVVFLIADEIEVSPVPFLLMMVFASNIGGAATLVGDPPNILIGSAAGLSFTDFLIHVTPVIVIIIIVFLFTVKMMYRNSFNISVELKARIKDLRAARALKNYKLLWQSLSVLSGVIIVFIVHHLLNLEAATVALGGAAILMIISNYEPDESFQHVEWETIFFFIGLFIIVEGLVKIGFIDLVAKKTIAMTGADMRVTTLFILWSSAVFSAVIDNIPYTATMIPVIKEVGGQIASNMNMLPAEVMKPLWWALALGACLGGNGTIIGASANVVIVGIAKKNGYKISFGQFCKLGFIFLVESIVIASIYLYIRYL